MESIFLHTNVTIIPLSILYVSLSYYIINLCISTSSKSGDCFSIFKSPSYTVYDNILILNQSINVIDYFNTKT
ncbi:HN1_G0018770.mRNA.1.CDS.1 [Saccharomyces cerevisiae]|nr:HN1_G0018770.mRNA.1.CDS.1 [Saccharomyces cerevisiae]